MRKLFLLFYMNIHYCVYIHNSHSKKHAISQNLYKIWKSTETDKILFNNVLLFCFRPKVKQYVNLIYKIPNGKFTFPELFKPAFFLTSSIIQFSAIKQWIENFFSLFQNIQILLLPQLFTKHHKFFVSIKAQRAGCGGKRRKKVYGKSNFLLEFFI